MRPASAAADCASGTWCACWCRGLLSALALGVAVWLLDGLSANTFWDVLWASAVTAVVGLLIRPAIVLVSAYVGWIAVVLAGLLGQALVTYVALEPLAGHHHHGGSRRSSPRGSWPRPAPPSRG